MGGGGSKSKSSSAKAGGGSKFDENGYYVYDDAPDKSFEKRLQKYVDNWTENVQLDGKDLQIVGTPRQVSYAQTIVANFFEQFDKEEKLELRIARSKKSLIIADEKIGVGERKRMFDASRVTRATKTWAYDMLKGRPIQAKNIIEKKNTLFPTSYYRDVGAFDYLSRLDELRGQYRKKHKAP